jgi:1-deoxy-D-xylulose-5-phosphate reductoisomerase
MLGNKNPIKRLAILGSTGSIGQQTLDIVRAMPDKFTVTGLAAGNNWDLLQKQLREFKPATVSFQDRQNQMNTGTCHPVSMEEMVSRPDVDMVVIATSGKSGLSPVLAAIKAGKKIALANKEPLVMAGELITAELKKNLTPAEIFPVDSEHSAIWQCLNGEAQRPSRIILTASGGPFLRYSTARLSEITVEQALKHPSWQMGKKVTIDSATLMNKGLEVIEAHWLFDMPYDKIDILIHPQSIVHSMIELIDGSIKAQLSYPDMRLPIQYALSYPDRLNNPGLPRLDWSQAGNLVFEKPDYEIFPCLKLALAAAKSGGTYPTALCAADEAAVEMFLAKKIRFTDMARLVERVLSRHHNIEHPGIAEILAADKQAREETLREAGR